jgi:hypothetical protein
MQVTQPAAAAGASMQVAPPRPLMPVLADYRQCRLRPWPPLTVLANYLPGYVSGPAAAEGVGELPARLPVQPPLGNYQLPVPGGCWRIYLPGYGSARPPLRAL